MQAQFDRSGKVIPIKFYWQGHNYSIESIGRRWKDRHGLHILVQANALQVYELLYQADNEQWLLVRKPRFGTRA